VVVLAAILDDLQAEYAALDAMVSPLVPAQWDTATPAEGWSVRDSVSHVYYFDVKALQALTQTKVFVAHAQAVNGERLPAGTDTTPGAEMGGALLVQAWRTARAALLDALRAWDPTRRVPWYGPAMSVGSFATARLMETWAHGCDVADALRLPLVVSPRLRSVCHIGVGARAYSFSSHGHPDPGDPIRVELTAPDGSSWTWGPADADQRITGPGLDFALLVTHRRHRDDTSLHVVGPAAEGWLSMAQAFAGPSGPGRQPLHAVTA
jgi:uncharacterized protein (TIGR03084 family)